MAELTANTQRHEVREGPLAVVRVSRTSNSVLNIQ